MSVEVNGVDWEKVLEEEGYPVLSDEQGAKVKLPNGRKVRIVPLRLIRIGPRNHIAGFLAPWLNQSTAADEATDLRSIETALNMN